MNNIIKYGRIVLDKKTAYICPLDSTNYLQCGDKNGKYLIREQYLKGTTEKAWDELYKKICIFNDSKEGGDV